jgi:hypothetical protein
MQRKDWEIITVGDRIVRETYTWTLQPTVQAADGAVQAPPQGTAVLGEQREFQVVQIAHGILTLVHLLDRSELQGARTTLTEVVELSEQGATRDARAACCEVDPKQFGWRWEAPARGEARLTGGFIVTRADGTQEYDRCPTATTKA